MPTQFLNSCTAGPLVSPAEAARKAIEPKRARLVDYLQTFPGDDVFERNPAPSRDMEW
jgi:hypothetical protein